MKTVFFGTPDFAVAGLEALVKHSEVLAVVCQPDKPAGRGMKLKAPPVKVRALELGLEVLQPKRIRSKSFRTRFKELAPELAVVAAYGKILPKSILEEVPRGFINLHASLLPKFRGAAPIHRCIIQGEAKTGISLMQLTPGMDEGPVYFMKEILLDARETVGTLHDRLKDLSGLALEEFMVSLLDDALGEAIGQDHSQATYAPKIENDEAEITWDNSSSAIDRLVRGTNPFPGAFTHLNSLRVKVFDAEVLEQTSKGEPGEVIEISDLGPIVATQKVHFF